MDTDPVISGDSRLTVLGSCGAWPEPGRACSGYVLEHAGFRIVIDLGYGSATAP
jgi:ribonuclease BN (tRNA processing enzyme)